MTYDEFRRQLGKAAISIREFAELLRMSPNTVSNKAQQGRVPDHMAVIAALIAEMAERQIDYRSIIGKLDLDGGSHRGNRTRND